MNASVPKSQDNIPLNPTKIEKIPAKIAKKLTTLTFGLSGYKAGQIARTEVTPSPTPISTTKTLLNTERLPFAIHNIFRAAFICFSL